MHKDILYGFNIYMKPLTALLPGFSGNSFLFQKNRWALHPGARLKPLIPLRIFLLIALPVSFASCDPASSIKKKDADGTVQKYKLPAPGKLDPALAKRLNMECGLWYDSILKNTGFNGSVLVAKNGHVIFEKYQGTAHLGAKDSITANTPLHIASVSKTFTAMAVLKLWQEKKLLLDDEFDLYFPAFNYPGVTIRSLLNHRSGLPNYLYFMDELGWDKKKLITNQDVFDYLVNRKADIKNISSPNTHFTYCNTNYALLALLIEKVADTSYPAYIKMNIFDPLQMTNSFVYNRADSAKSTPSYDWRGQLIPNNHLDGVYGDKNIYSTTHDLFKWDRLLATNLLFLPATLEQAYTPYSNEKAGIRNYGLGWRMNVYPDGTKIIFHNGWWHGNNAVFIRLIKEDATVIVLGNRYNRGIYKSKYLVNIFGPDYFTSEEEEQDTAKTTAPAVNTGKDPGKIKKRSSKK